MKQNLQKNKPFRKKKIILLATKYFRVDMKNFIAQDQEWIQYMSSQSDRPTPFSLKELRKSVLRGNRTVW